MQFINFGNPANKWSVSTVLDITSKVYDYCRKRGIENAELCTIEDSTWEDKTNMRYDIEIRYNSRGHLIQQKLLMLKGEILDGKSFHERFEEFYPKSARICSKEAV